MSRWQLRIINLKSHAGFGDQTHDFINVCHGTNRLKSPNLFRCCLDRNWFIPLNSLVSLSIHFLFLPKYYSCELYKLIHNKYFSHCVHVFFWGSFLSPTSRALSKSEQLLFRQGHIRRLYPFNCTI